MPSPLIFITGATGFIGAHVLLQALSAGYRMRLSVRKESQIAPLKALAGTHASNMDFTNIPDLTVPGAFDKALNGVSYIFHIASPMPGKGTDFRMEYLAPAVDGTLALLNAAKNVSSIKRVIIVSSALALISYEDFASGTFHVIEGTKVTIDPESTSFPDDNPGKKYHASKVLAHQSTRSWVAETKPRFSVITLHPSFVFGPNLTQTSPEGLDGTNAMLMGCLISPKPLIPMSAVDVRDVALAHVKALDVELGSGTGEVHEFLLSAGEEEGWTWENVVSFVKEKFSGVDVKLEGPFDGVATGDTRRARDVLGIKWRAMEDTVGEFLGQQMRLRAKV